MRKLWMTGTVLGMVVLMLLLIPNIPIGATAKDFQMEGSTLTKYTGTVSTVSVPANVEIIGRSAFEGNVKIKKIVIPDSVKTIEPYAFWGCENLETVILGEGVQEVADFTFTACARLKQVSLSKETKRIGIMAFADCVSLGHIKIPVSVTDIHETAFDGIEELTIHAKEYSYPYRYALARGQNATNAPVPTEAPEGILDENSPLPAPIPTPEPTNRPIGEIVASTTIVGNSAVFLVDGRKMVPGNEKESDAEYLPTVNTKIEDWKYYGDKSLVEIMPETGTETIGHFAYARSNVSQVVLPDGLKEIQYAAFYHCDKLENIVIPLTVNRIEAKVFEFTPWMNDFLNGKRNVGSDFLIVGDGVLLAYRGNKRSVSIPEGVKYIAPEAFLNHDEIEEVLFPETIIQIDDKAFYGCAYKPAY